MGKDKLERNNDENEDYGIIHFFITCGVLGLIFSSVLYSGNYLPPSKPTTAPQQDFSGDRARIHLEAITSIGPRPAGSHAADVEAVDYLVKQLNAIKQQADPRFHIEVEVQRASGSFAFTRNIGMTSTYRDAANVIAKISPSKLTSHYVLANAHFDTVPNTEGASDDTVNCAVLMEMFRALSKSDPASMKHGVMFLFNGAEEGGLAGSHGFIQHRWFPLVKLVVNLEAAGSGGQEFVFQTGPGHPWILGMYASTAKYPFTSVLAQELFRTEIIPSDTDYRVWVQYGHLVGLDIAFVKNGYVYHTRYDDAKSIPSGSIQRAGDNVLSLIKGIISSPYLNDPGTYKHGDTVFFDVLGLFIVHYPKRLHLLLNWITCGVVVLYVLSQVLRHRKYSSQKEHSSSRLLTDSTVSAMSLVSCVVIILFTWLLAIVLPLIVAKILTKANILMTWFPRPKFALLLYGSPAVFGLLLGHFIGDKLLKRCSFVSFHSFVCAHLVIDTALLFYCNLHAVSSSVFLWLWLVFPFVFVCIFLEKTHLLPETKPTVRFLLHTIATIPPALMSVYSFDMLFNFFIPIMGRMGDVLPGDMVVAGLTGFAVVFTLSYFTNLYHNGRNKHHLLIFFGVISLSTLIYTLSGKLHPYSRLNPVTPKRVYLTHMQRTFHSADGKITREDAGVWIQPTDALGFTSLAGIAHFAKAEEFQCDGSYCGLPYYYAKRKIFRRSWYLRGEKPEGISAFTLSTNIYQKATRPDGSVRFNFNIPGPDHMVLFLTLEEGVELDWSMYKSGDGTIFRTPDYMGGYTYIVFYTQGMVKGETRSNKWTFWMEFKKKSGDSKSSVFGELGVARHYLHGSNSRSRLLNATIDALPEWVHDNSWCSHYDSFTLAG